MKFVHFIESDKAITGDQLVLWQRDHYEYEIDNRTQCQTTSFFGPYDAAVEKYKLMLRGEREPRQQLRDIPVEHRAEVMQNRFIEDLLKPYL